MKISITSRNINISDNLEKFIKDKIVKIARYDKKIYSINIILSKESRAEKVEVIVNSENGSYMTKAHSSVFEKTVLRALDNLKAQILKSKKKY